MRRRRTLPLSFALAVAAAALAGCGRHEGASPGSTEEATMQRARTDTSDRIAINQLKTSANEGPQVSSTAFQSNGPIPAEYSAYDKNVSLPLAWSTVPNVKSWAVIVEDPDAPKSEPFVHWVAWDIPGSATSLPEGIAPTPEVDHPSGMRQGKNGSGKIGWFGPRPPQGDAAHHYHIQVFALDTPNLEVSGPADRKALVKAMQGHVMADGELIGLYQAAPRQ